MFNYFSPFAQSFFLFPSSGSLYQMAIRSALSTSLFKPFIGLRVSDKDVVLHVPNTSSSLVPCSSRFLSQEMGTYQRVLRCAGLSMENCSNANTVKMFVSGKCIQVYGWSKEELTSCHLLKKCSTPVKALETSKTADVSATSSVGEDRIGVLLLNLGEPETLGDVQPFLYNLFADPDIVRLPRMFQFLRIFLALYISVAMAPKSKEGFASIGCASPLRQITDAQAEELRKALYAKNVPAKVYAGMGYWHPFIEKAIEEIKRDGITKLVVLPLYSQFSILTSGSSLRLLESIFRDDEYFVNMRPTVIPSWYQRDAYTKATGDLIEKELQKFSRPEEVVIFFNAHVGPLAYVEEAGYSYKAVMEECVELIMGELEKRNIHNSFTLSYQSMAGPVEWLKPYASDTIIDLGKKGVKSLLAVPISFVREHIETLEEIYVEYKELALGSGVENWGRVPALGCEPTFIEGLADAVIESLPYVRAMAVSNLDARQSLVPLGSVEELLAAYDPWPKDLPPPTVVWSWSWTKSVKFWNGRAALYVSIFFWFLSSLQATTICLNGKLDTYFLSKKKKKNTRGVNESSSRF